MARRNISRRGFFAGAGLTGATAVIASCAKSEEPQAGSPRGDQNGTSPQEVSAGRATDQTVIAFDGPHQAGIATAPQTHALLVAYRVGGQRRDREGLGRIMKIWTNDARSLTQGHKPLADLESELAADPRNLTITVGWGPQLIVDAGLKDKTPQWVMKNRDGLPSFTGDKLDPKFSGGDLILQICGDDLTAVSHAARVLTRSVRDFAQPIWTQRGFIDSPTGETPRNLLGFKDGTAIPRSEEDYQKNIWDEQGGSAMVVRRVVYDMPGWEALDRSSREVVFGRTIDSGAPLGKSEEFDNVDLNAVGEDGLPLIDAHSHVGITAGEGVAMRRRAYNWDGEITELGSTGLIFICFQADPDTAFTPLQKRLAENDRLNQWTTHVGSAVFWCPGGTGSADGNGGAGEGAYWGENLLEG
ncbi:Dyp-type peroxidase [uncultured Corynebacterium sp.]|uniref:Dyp-type peroxidase n=1 Tax=uncultured Corynebacterium sp. TaxID=159447 RepID=UPI002594A2EA|nr:Dyp-type peroxidase [uncultured Corynebacterium sp.]